MKRILTLVLVLAATAASAGQVYKWTDSSGKVHFSDKPVAGESQKVEPKIGTVPPGQGEPDAALAKHQQECAAAKDKLAAYESAAKIVERDALGNERQYSGDDKQKLIDMQRRKVASSCEAATAPAAAANTTGRSNRPQ